MWKNIKNKFKKQKIFLQQKMMSIQKYTEINLNKFLQIENKSL